MLKSRGLCAVIALSFAALLLGACTAQTGTIDEKGLRPHLNVDLQIPEKLELHKTSQFRVEVLQGGKPAAVDEVIFELWPEEQVDQLISLKGNKIDDGIYGVDYEILENGLYRLKSRITAGELEVFPAKRFAVGEKAVLELAAIEDQEALDNQGSNQSTGGHHHH
ncbi:hypothetical protein ACX93W_07280 [Paenibacillus sp. CAU 1782]